MTERNRELEGELASALVRSGILFNLYSGTAHDGHEFGLFQVPFGEGAAPFDVWLYLTGAMVVAASPCSITSDASRRLSILEAVGEFKLVRLVRDDAQELPNVFWLEAYSLVPATRWESPGFAADPMFSVSGAMKHLMKANSDAFAPARNAKMRMIEAPLYARLAAAGRAASQSQDWSSISPSVQGSPK